MSHESSLFVEVTLCECSVGLRVAKPEPGLLPHSLRNRLFLRHVGITFVPCWSHWPEWSCSPDWFVWNDPAQGIMESRMNHAPAVVCLVAAFAQ
jgi:hypothetical protein